MPDAAGITDAVFRAVRGGNAFEETVERLLEGIKLGIYAPGDRLPAERELTRLLGVSRITLREALRELGAAGYVETKRGRFGGTFVLRAPEPLSLASLASSSSGLEDALVYREVVETGAAEMAARATLSQQQREELADCLATVSAAAGPAAGSYAAGPGTASPDAAAPDEAGAAGPGAAAAGYRAADTRLHLAIADAAGSPLLLAGVLEARVRLVDLLNAIPMLARNLEHANVQHTRIVQAILAGDAVAARYEMAEHVAGTAALLRGFLRGESSLACSLARPAQPHYVPTAQLILLERASCAVDPGPADPLTPA